ncbi:hypothetical protein DLM78_00495 [Leptospira stimsonii]|uniref:Uncharacterized protein n=1 Tax=Leptospira stimsonii TaxID=2202203 RepID=A0A8B6RYY3_9LEPT|nr:hypothetical protein DLM78_00495 [Leptospira stimsonii]
MALTFCLEFCECIYITGLVFMSKTVSAKRLQAEIQQERAESLSLQGRLTLERRNCFVFGKVGEEEKTLVVYTGLNSLGEIVEI